ncbi:FimV/HubP family polar landmark protein [Marinobacter sp. LV10MA510-1]|uniref:FimV/HubP family polar landmark protein n=1 Tax=Marinobacter sp. LV10MA510-1 TaxID=1415567 RepID=UPI000BF8FCDF|nr:FimV/HubP family polar landmark protein [Marinobacter sp. LV10MA510-1]PFG08901.1 pilus assembly protein FimV [Marinobacter sp. LV10MA510-1]
MKVRKLAVALALAGGLGSGVAQALGLGEVELQSYLNEPLDAQIVLRQSRGVSPGDVFVNVASESAYQRVGLNRGQFASKLKFQVVTRSDGSLAVSVSSREPLREPYLNFLLELTWPSGRLLREYAVLVDPPVYAAETGIREPLVAAPSAGRSNSSPSANSGAVSRPAPASSGSAQSLASGGVYGPTTSSDTLWSIATRMRPNNSVSVQQVMLAIQEINPDAFIGGNINRLKRGEVLRAPTLAQIQRLGQGEANQVVRAQNQDVNTTRATIDASPAATPSAPAAIDGGDAELKLIVAETEAPQAVDNTEQSGSAGTDGNQADGADAGTTVALEELDSARRENSELTTRVDALQEQVETLQRLLELKNSQLADMQQAGMNGDNAVVSMDQNAADEPAMDGVAEAETASAVAVQPEQDAQPQIAQPDPAEESAAQGGLVNSIMNNLLYQMVLGGGLLLLLLLLLLVSRRKSKNQDAAGTETATETATERETEADNGFEQAPLVESVPSSGSFDLDLGLDDQEPPAPDAEPDVMAEVNSYLAYGQHEQAVNTLESAISREPSRTELRLKLLAVYADAQDRVAFERQYGELRALDDDQAMAEADRLLTDLEQAEAAPSIDDLESELRSGSFAGSFGGFDEEAGEAKDSAKPTSDDPIDYDLSGIDGLGDKEELAKPEAPEDFEDFVLSDDFAREFADEDAAPLSKADDTVNTAGNTSDDDDLSLDEAFLDELDAELDKDDPEAELKPLDMQEPDLDMQESDLEKLDLEISDDDLALMGEFADGADSSNHAGGDDAESESEFEAEQLPEMTDAELLALEMGDDPQAEVEAEEELGAKLAENQDDEDDISLDDLETLELPEEDLPAYDLPEDDLPEFDLLEDDVLEEDLPIVAAGAPQTIDESDLGDDDDFDFLAGTDEAATKLDLAQAYVEMGDIDGARDILMEVELEGTAEQKAEAKELLKNLS